MLLCFHARFRLTLIRQGSDSINKKKTLNKTKADDRHVILASNVHARGNRGRGEGVKGGREERGKGGSGERGEGGKEGKRGKGGGGDI